MTGNGQAGRQGKKRAKESGPSLAAELAAYAICKDSPDLSGRQEVHGFAIDSAEPGEPMDRDDAVRVEHRKDAVLGRLTILHVTIADVASVVPRAAEREVDRKLGALDEAARAQAQTKYFSHGSQPMFPRRLQDRMSLEHNKERRGLTVSITFDEHCNRIHTEFSRTRISTVCKSYREASDNIRDGQGPGNAMQQVALLAKNLLKRKPGTTDLPHYDEKTGLYTDTEGHSRHISSEASSSYIAVQGCMIAANEAVAEVMRGSNFLFRNHCGRVSEKEGAAVFYTKEERPAHRSKLILGAAEYGEECRGHYGLGSRMYSHVTSPIRRYADVVNQRMQHWAIDLVESVAAAAMAEGGRKAMAEERLLRMVWDQAQALLHMATLFKETGRNRSKIEAGQRLEEVIADILLPVMGAARAHKAAGAAIRRIDAIELPYTKKEMATLARGLNEKARKRGPVISHDELMNAVLDAIFLPAGVDDEGYMPNPEHKEEAIRRRRPYNFAVLLDAAARRGDNNDFFTGEVSRRLQSADDRGELVRNLYSVLVLADKEKDSRWQVLKREAFQMLKDDPELAERVFNHLRAQDLPPKLFMVETSVLSRGRSLPEALVVLTHEGVDYAAPMKDISDTPEAARAGAILTFFRNYGMLTPYHEMQTPKLIDLALGIARVKRGERMGLLSKICGKDFTIETTSAPSVHDRARVKVTLRITQHSDGEVLEKTRDGWAGLEEEYYDKCAKDMMVDYRFADMLSQADVVATDAKPEAGQMAFAKRLA